MRDERIAKPTARGEEAKHVPADSCSHCSSHKAELNF